jgi:valyl-tRNA synthetase
VTETLLTDAATAADNEAKSKDAEFSAHLTEVVKDITKHLQDSKLGLAAEILHNEFWHWFCDVCIEDCKQGQISPKLLTEGLTTFIALLHPFMPYVTEAIWQELQSREVITPKSKLLVLSDWPTT